MFTGATSVLHAQDRPSKPDHRPPSPLPQANSWNYVDWGNYIIFFMSAWYLRHGFIHPVPAEPSRISREIGFMNDWKRNHYFIQVASHSPLRPVSAPPVSPAPVALSQ